MAAINTVTQLVGTLELKSVWTSKTASGDQTKGLLIMIKNQTSEASYNVKVDTIKAVRVDIGLDSGETDGILVIDSYDFVFPVGKKASEHDDVNDRCSFLKINQGLPKKFYYRIAAIETNDKVYKVGDKINNANPTCNIQFNLEELDF